MTGDATLRERANVLRQTLIDALNGRMPHTDDALAILELWDEFPALLARVSVLEDALKRIASEEPFRLTALEAQKIARKALASSGPEADADARLAEIAAESARLERDDDLHVYLPESRRASSFPDGQKDTR